MLFPQLRFDISTKSVEKRRGSQIPVLVVMLEVISRTMPAIMGSFCIRSSTLRIEERTVEWLRPSYSLPMSCRDMLVRVRIRYMENWRDRAVFLMCIWQKSYGT